MGARYWRRLAGAAGPVKEDIAGAVDGLIEGAWQGWALDRALPGRALAVTLVTASGRRIAALADCYRADVHQAMPGHGYYGFRVPARLLDDEEPTEVLVGDTALPHRPSRKMP